LCWELAKVFLAAAYRDPLELRTGEGKVALYELAVEGAFVLAEQACDPHRGELIVVVG
jgi:hypothetical protein